MGDSSRGSRSDGSTARTGAGCSSVGGKLAVAALVTAAPRLRPWGRPVPRCPVLVVHGDTHRYQHNHPLLDPARGVPFERFTRVEVPGSPLVGGVWIEVDPDAAEPFTVKPVYAVSLETLGE